MLLISALTAPVLAQHRFFSTNDWQNAGGGATPDTWADVKTPGNGLRYAAGTTNVGDTFPQTQPMFSDEDCLTPTPPLNPLTGMPYQWAFGIQSGVVQVTDEAGSIQSQSYIHGFSQGNSLSTFVRGLAVLPGTDADDTRIVVCGDVFDETLPEAATPLWFNPTNSLGTGFVAVLDGNCSLLWTYQFFGQDDGARTAITDVAIHRDPATDEDVITYCGASTNGNYAPSPPSPANTMAPLRPFVAPPPITGSCDTYTDGEAHNNGATPTTPTTGWDGIVGRLTCSHVNPQPAGVQRVFHSIVGGTHEEGLFGITEIDQQRFAVVGSLATSPQSGGDVCPLTRPFYAAGEPDLCFSAATPPVGTFGLFLVFDASSITAVPTTVLELETATLIGHADHDTVARDVIYHGDRFWIVGSTNDPDLVSAIGASDNPILSGSEQGFVLSSRTPDNGFDTATFFTRSTTESGATGIGAWPENPDHVTVVGWADHGQGKEMQTLSLWIDSTGSWTTHRLREHTIATLGIETPGADSAGFTSSFIGGTFTVLGQAEGGGIAVDARGLATIVGSTRGSNDYPYFDELYPTVQQGRAPQASHGVDTDAVLTVIDMLPEGVARTDGSGWRTVNWSIAPGYDGGTTPLCALSANGGAIDRMFVDYEGPAPRPGVSATLIVDRPPAAVWADVGILQFGLPTAAPLPYSVSPYGQDVEIWMTLLTTPSDPATLIFLPPTNRSLRLPLATLPPAIPGGNAYTIQFTCWLTSPICTATNPVEWVASPALMVWY